MQTAASSTGTHTAHGSRTHEVPEDLGFSKLRLQLLDTRFSTDVATGLIPGAVVLVARHGRIAYYNAFGYRDRGRQLPMQTNSLFWVASMTKPVTSVAALALVEEAKLHLRDPVARFLPEFADLQVGVEQVDADGDRHLVRVAPHRDMTMHDLFRHTSGLTYGAFGTSLVNQAYQHLQPYDFGQTNAEMVGKLARLPLAYHPGTTFEYGMSTDVLGRVIEVVSGQPLDRFIEERIAVPLRMRDTGFVIPSPSQERVALPQGEQVSDMAPPVRTAPGWLSGGGGLWSTAYDYWRFAQMLLNRGELDGVRMLSARTVAWMTSNHLPPDVAYGPYVEALDASAPIPSMGQGFGLGVTVRIEEGRNPLPGSVGDFYWPGVSGTSFWVDPKEQLVAVLMLRAPDERLRYRAVLRELVYQALEH
ncbi:MAG: beta-lactamase family protein [Gemmatimonadales bacterium]|nr:beta-lactamase family protein [Gemmatimonadales bacterium]